LSCNSGPLRGYGSSREEDWRAERRTHCSAISDPYERERCWRDR
jgi:hypothetical protein